MCNFGKKLNDRMVEDLRDKHTAYCKGQMATKASDTTTYPEADQDTPIEMTYDDIATEIANLSVERVKTLKDLDELDYVRRAIEKDANSIKFEFSNYCPGSITCSHQTLFYSKDPSFIESVMCCAAGLLDARMIEIDFNIKQLAMKLAAYVNKEDSENEQV